MYITHVFDPIISVVIHGALIALYSISIHNQAASDMSDPRHPQSGPPWYITKSCGAPVDPKNKGYCMQAKGAFAVSILLVYVTPKIETDPNHILHFLSNTLANSLVDSVLFFAYFLLSLFSLYPTKTHRAIHRGSKIPDEESSRPWEMTNAPQTPGTTGGLKSPTTPRTMAFETLSGDRPAKNGNGQLPLRHHISMGDETYSGPSRRP